jgi:hypothetical protein
VSRLQYPSARDPRLDFFRGVALVCIFIDHIPGNSWSRFTLHRLGFSDASELFVFVSAYTAGLVYMSLATREGLWAVTRRAWRRALQVYGVHVLLLAVTSVLAGWLSRSLRDPQFIKGLNVRPLLQQPAESAWGVLALSVQPVFMNILPLYVVLMVALPLMLWLLRTTPLLTLILSFEIYAAVRLLPASWVSNPVGTDWAFNPLAWQFLFVIGVALGAAARGLPLRLPRSAWTLWASALYVLGALLVGAEKWSVDGTSLPLPGWMQTLFFPLMERANLSLWRLGHLLALACLASAALPIGSRLLDTAPARLLRLYGRHSLLLFSVGVVLSVLGWAALVWRGPTMGMVIVVNLAGLGVMALVAWLASWLTLTPLRRRPVSPLSEPPRGFERPGPVAIER